MRTVFPEQDRIEFKQWRSQLASDLIHSLTQRSRRWKTFIEMEGILVIRRVILKFTSTFKIGLTHAKQGDEYCHDSTGIYLFS